MAIRDANGHAGVALAEGPEELWPVSGSEAGELPDWRSLCERERERAEAAAAGVPLSGLIRRAMARTRTWTASAAEVERERTRQVSRIGNNLNQIARWANTHKGAIEAVEVIGHLVAIKRALGALSLPEGTDADAR